MISPLFRKQKTIVLRDYQAEAVAAIYDHLRTRKDNPCVVLPTGSGKTPVMATICSDAVQKWDGRVLVLAHVKELLEQTAETLQSMAPDIPIGVYSAGLNSRQTRQPVIVAGIQSIYKRAGELGPFDLILADECHLIPPDGEGMYRTFLADANIVNPNVRLIGLTATPYRMKGGMICSPENMLNHICCEAGVKELIAQGYLCPLVTRAGKTKANFDNLHMRAGEFVSSEVDSLMDNHTIVQGASEELVQLTAERKSVLIFCTCVHHCKQVSAAVSKFSGMDCGIVTGETPGLERASILRRFKDGELKYLTNINVLTTGFDATNIDAVVMLRPTASPGLYYQMVGRGLRLHEGVDDCLVLDYGGNVLRHGPIDELKVKQPGQKGGEAPARECPKCQLLMHTSVMVCPGCGFEFPEPIPETHSDSASTAGILSGQVVTEIFPVEYTCFYVHEKRGADEGHPKTMRVEYCIGYMNYKSEWVCPEHTGYARGKFEAWWRQRSNDPFPSTAEEAVRMASNGCLADTTSITVRTITGEKYSNIIAYELGDAPPRADGSDEHEPAMAEQSGPHDWIDDDDIPF